MEATGTMSRWHRQRGVRIALAVMVTPLVLRADDPRPRPAHLAAAEELVAHVSPANNEYAHKDCFIHWKGSDGAGEYANRTDCSEFLNLLLEHTYGAGPEQLQAWTGHRRPTARHWYEAAAGARLPDAFEIIPKVSEARPGDVIFIKFPPENPDTGHVVLLPGRPERRAASAPTEAGTDQWEVLIIDSSKSGHGLQDTRRRPDGTVGEGVGEGTLRLYSGGDGKLAGYAWSVLKASKFQPVVEHPAVIVRFKPSKTTGEPKKPGN